MIRGNEVPVPVEKGTFTLPIVDGLEQIISADYFQLLQDAEQTGNYAPLENRLQTLAQNDSHMQAVEEGETGTKYYKPFVNALYPKIIPALREALENGTWPEILLTFDEAQAMRVQLGSPALGSPQDFFYGFTSQRYKNWGPTLTGMGFVSACMTGEASITVCMAPRFLSLPNPVSIPELDGAISTTFWSSTRAIFGRQTVAGTLAPILQRLPDQIPFTQTFEQLPDGSYLVRANQITGETAQTISTALEAGIAGGLIAPMSRFYATNMLSQFELIAELPTENQRRTQTRRYLNGQISGAAKAKQEQLALKYMEEGNYLQKLLLGRKVEHIQSNVKMVKNPMRGNKCEVDSIYRVLEERRVVLVEAKGSPEVSRGQLYQLYETYRLKLPSNWEMDIVSLFMDDPTPDEAAQGIGRCVGMALVSFNEQVFGSVTSSLLAVQASRYLRWQIRQA